MKTIAVLSTVVTKSWKPKTVLVVVAYRVLVRVGVVMGDLVGVDGRNVNGVGDRGGDCNSGGSGELAITRACTTAPHWNRVSSVRLGG